MTFYHDTDENIAFRNKLFDICKETSQSFEDAEKAVVLSALQITDKDILLKMVRDTLILQKNSLLELTRIMESLAATNKAFNKEGSPINNC